ncbi:MAG: LCP family protein [Actinobacteria bacterium]|nr:LCP family protein [Actinomycetota bacterium]MBW3649238.1 LCP family protein [Actinomycetota bacterium]
MFEFRGGMSVRQTSVALVVVCGILFSAIAAVAVRTASDDNPVVIVGSTAPSTSTPLTEPAVVPQPEPPAEPQPGGGAPEPPPAAGLKAPNGRPYGPAIQFTSNIAVPDRLVYVLVLGSDARPNEDLMAARADSIHLLAINPSSGAGTIVGFPRDSYVEFPGGGRGKINDALTRGGPKLVAETVRRLTGLPVHYYVLTGFVGLSRMVDELGGVDVRVDRRMKDRLSGTRFDPGWHRFDGAEALAFTRDRTSVANGDFSRSENHGTLLLATLGKLRAEVADDAGLFHWMGILGRNCRLDVPADELPRLAALARRLAPEKINNLVVPGRIGYAGRASVVFLGQEAPRLFADLRDDALVNGSASATTTSPPPPPESTTTTTSAPPPPPPPPPVPSTTSTTSLLG